LQNRLADWVAFTDFFWTMQNWFSWQSNYFSKQQTAKICFL